jgi:hypothetical protein
MEVGRGWELGSSRKIPGWVRMGSKKDSSPRGKTPYE